MHHLIIGHDHSRRAQYWLQSLGNTPAQWVNYQQIAQGYFPSISEPTTVRITSPGEDFGTYKLLAQLGGGHHPDQLTFERGGVHLHHFWYDGWCQVLDKIQAFLSTHPLAFAMNHPNAIKLAFHKIECQRLLAENGIPIPKIYIDQLNSFEELLIMMAKNHLPQVFLKPAHGSSASGIMMFKINRAQMRLATTIRAERKGRGLELFNCRRLQHYNDPATIQSIIEHMIPNRLHVEKWIIKKRYQAKSTDFRVLTIHQQPIFIQPRHSKHPITNLHLGNEKGSLPSLEKEWGSKVIEKVHAVAQRTASLFPDLFYAGIDIAIDRYNAPYVLEVNPFGDFLKEIFVDGKNTYELELQYWQQQLAQRKENKFNVG